MKMIYKSLMCEIKARSRLKAEIGDMCTEAVIYAVCRLFTKSTSLCREYVTESYYMRLAKGKGRRAKNHRCIVPAFLAELDGELIQIDFSVDVVGVTIQSIKSVVCRGA